MGWDKLAWRRKDLADLYDKNVREARAKRLIQRQELTSAMAALRRIMRAMELRAARDAERRDIKLAPERDPLLRMFERRAKKVEQIYNDIWAGKWTETPPISLLI